MIQDKKGCNACKYTNKRDKDMCEMRGYANKKATGSKETG